jgi:hypothetical protein
MLFAHHTQSYLGIAIEINDQPFPNGMVDHVLAFGAFLLMVYGVFALLRDLLRLIRKRKAAAVMAERN